KAAWTVAVLANPLVLMLVAFGLYAGGGYESEWNFAWKLITVLHSLSGYNLVLSSLAVNLTIAATYLIHRRGNLKITSPGIWIAVGLALTFLAMPFRLSGAAFADVRVLVAAALILPAFITTGAVSFVTQCAI